MSIPAPKSISTGDEDTLVEVNETRASLEGATLPKIRLSDAPLRPTQRPLASRAVVVPRDPEVEKALRRSVVLGLPKARRYHDPNQIEICLPPDFLPQTATAQMPGYSQAFLGRNVYASDDDTAAQARMDSGLITSLNPMTILSAGRADPFAQYPIRITSIDQWILDQLYTSPDPALRTFRESWLPIAVNDAAVFHQVLASSAWRIRKIRGQDPNNDVSLAHHSLALRTVNNRLSDPEHLRSDYAIASITILVCYSIVNDDFDSFQTHMDGLAQLVQLRGGFEVIEHNTMLRRITFSVDVSGGARQDLVPRFPLPERFIKNSRGAPIESPLPRGEQAESALWGSLFSTDYGMMGILKEVHTAILHAKHRSLRNETWIRVEYASLWIDPITYKLLSTKADVDPNEVSSIIREVVRLSIMLFFGEIRRKCGALAVSTSVQMKKHKALMSAFGMHADWSLARPMLLWVLFFGLFESWQQAEHNWYVRALATVTLQMGFSSWHEVIAVVRDVLWLGPIHDERLGKFREGFETELLLLIAKKVASDNSTQ